MVSKKKHNSKSLRRYKTAELRQFIKEHKLPIKRTSKLSKSEIIVAMLKSQRNGHHQCISKIPFKGKKLLTEKQLVGLRKGQNAMADRRLKMKSQVKTSQKIDKQEHAEFQITKETIEEIKDEIRIEEKKTQHELVTEGGDNELIRINQEILTLEDIIERSNKNIQKDIDYFNELLEQEREELEQKKEELEEQKPIKGEEEFIKSEIKILTKSELTKLLIENGIEGSKKHNIKKNELIDLVYNNRDKIPNLEDRIEAKKESKM
jgi:hypothetical protein